jgi:type II secretory pathway component PulF
MPLIVTPGLLAQRAELYQQLSSLLSAGVSMLQALEMLRKNPPSRAFRQPLTHVQVQLGQGYSFSEALRLQKGWLPLFDLALLQAGEESGRLPECCRLLSSYYDQRARLVRQVMSTLSYPLFLAHFALLVFPLTHLTALVQTFDVIAFLGAKLVIALPFYLVTLFLILAAQADRSESWRALVERLLGVIPLVGKARRQLALARLAAALEALVNAGVSIIDGWKLAAEASGSPALRKSVRSWHGPLAAGKTHAELVQASSEFPEVFANLYATGELSGQLDQTLGRLHRHYEEEGSRRLQLVAQWFPRLLYMVILLSIAYFILKFWTGYFRNISDAMQF